MWISLIVILKSEKEHNSNFKINSNKFPIVFTRLIFNKKITISEYIKAVIQLFRAFENLIKDYSRYDYPKYK